MTTTQIAYWDLQERRRSNLANEDLKLEGYRVDRERITSDMKRTKLSTFATIHSAHINAGAKIFTGLLGLLG